jgi:NAD(P)-dependent dehydrogenase (short-subunit alcohol dehydrogenase family)
MGDGALAGHVSLVTGGNSGIGLGLAAALAQAGATVAIWGRDPVKNEAAVERIEADGGTAHAFVCDVADEQQVIKSFADVRDELGHVDSLFAAAGVPGQIHPFVETTHAQWREVLDVNLDGTFLCAREMARHLVDRGDGGSIVLVSSIGARYGSPGMDAYAASKAALISLAQSIAVGLARHGVRCNALLPGWTETPMNAALRSNERFVRATTERTPTRRWATPDDYAEVAVFLADPRMTFHTGDAVVVDGGYLIF